MASNSKVRLCFATNQNHKEVKPAVVDKLEYEVLLKAASSKLRVKAKRLFTPEGVEITPENIGTFPVRSPNDHLEQRKASTECVENRPARFYIPSLSQD